ncbi:zinc finger protein 541 isoform X5 [Gallus gallus]|uniref:zinc finger protein 541 isoform X5 n=1 Tax=Gallus gallus TaxID=9031 RepID=UPI001AEB7D7D|nr:zinc finger protein 541 isoform X5 [Gallus gallus]
MRSAAGTRRGAAAPPLLCCFSRRGFSHPAATMEQFSFGDESSVSLEIQLLGFTESPGPELSLQGAAAAPPDGAAPPDTAGAALEDGLSVLSLCPGREWDGEVQHGLCLPGVPNTDTAAAQSQPSPPSSPLPCGCCGTLLCSTNHSPTDSQQHQHPSRTRKGSVCPERRCERCELQPPRCPQSVGCPPCSLVEDSSVPEGCPQIPAAAAAGDELRGSVAPSPALLEPPGMGADPGAAVPRFAVLSSHPWVSTAPLCAQRSSSCFTLKPSPAGREAPLSCSFLPEYTDASPFPLMSSGVEEVALGRPEDGAQPWQSMAEQQAVLSGGGQLRAACPEPGTQNLLQVLAASQHALSHVLTPKGPKDSSPCAREHEGSAAMDRLQNKAASSKGERSRGCGVAAGRSWRVPAARREKLSAGLAGTASPSQVAMASFAPRQQSGLTVLQRIQGGNICSFPGTAQEDGASAASATSSAAPTNSSDCDGVFLCKNCHQVFYTQKGLGSHMCFRDEQWLLPQRREEPQGCAAEDGSAARPELQEEPCEAGAALLIPVSVPVLPGGEVTPKESQDGKSPQLSSHPKKRKRQILPKPLFIPPPPPPEAQPGPGGCYRSNLRSPVLLMDRLLRDLLQCSPYTPPPMLSPVREGSGLYFNAVCSSTAAEPCRLLGSVLDRMDQDFGLCLMKDGTKISIEPHINIGSRFQAEIPTLQDRPGLGSAEQAALVWKPWGDIATNEETQDRGCFTLYLQEFGGPLVKNAFAAAFCTPRGSALLFRALFHGAEGGLGAGAVGCEWLCAPRWAAGGGQLGGSPQQCPSPLFFGTPWVLRWGPMRFDFHCLAVMELLNMACSSVMPGGGTNLELALHCLHEARGNVVDALELLLFGWPHKSQSHPLANYRYTGSDVWTPVERQLFRNAFHAHKKDFYLIQKKVQTKNVSQCVEYYYIWKKIIKFDHSRAQNADKKAKRDGSEAEEAEEKPLCPPKKRHCLLPKESSKKSCRKAPHGAGSPSCSVGRAPGGVEHHNVFPCTECERVFDKIKGRNAHMKRHRPQHRAVPLLQAQWALGPLKREEAAAGGALSSSWGAEPPE